MPGLCWENKVRSGCVLTEALPGPPEIKWTPGERQANATVEETEWVESAADGPSAHSAPRAA